MTRLLPCLGLVAVLAPSTQAQDTAGVGTTSLVAFTLQDEPRRLPKDITAMLTRADRRIRFELVKLSGDTAQSLAGTSVTVINANGETKKITADESGVATLENANPGLHAVVIGGVQGHSAIPVAVREASADAPAQAGPATLRLPLVDVEPKEVINLARSSRPADDSVSYGDIDQDFIASAGTTESFGYRVRLSNQGDLVGQVLSLVRQGVASADVEGTNVMVYSGSRLAGRAIADQRGYFQLPGLTPGAYGLVASGPGGYAAFAFEAYSAQTVSRASATATLVSVATHTLQPSSGDVMPVFLVPSPMVPALVTSLEQSYGPLLGDGNGDSGFGVGLGGAAGLAGLGAAAAGSSGGGGSSGAGGSVGGLGGLAALAGIGAVGVAIAEDEDDDEPGTNASTSSVIIVTD